MAPMIGAVVYSLVSGLATVVVAATTTKSADPITILLQGTGVAGAVLVLFVFGLVSAKPEVTRLQTALDGANAWNRELVTQVSTELLPAAKAMTAAGAEMTSAARDMLAEVARMQTRRRET